MSDLTFWTKLGELLQPFVTPILTTIAWYARKLVRQQIQMNNRVLIIEVYLKQKDHAGFEEVEAQLKSQLRSNGSWF